MFLSYLLYFVFIRSKEKKLSSSTDDIVQHILGIVLYRTLDNNIIERVLSLLSHIILIFYFGQATSN